jgi:uncharacterized protein (TIGR02265 family)
MTSPDVWKDRFTFPQLFEGYVKGLGERFTPALRAKLKAAGLDLDKPPPAIPAVDVPKYMDLIVNEVWPGMARDEQLHRLGRAYVEGWPQGLLGAAATRMLRLIGPKRALLRLDRVFSTTNNFNKATTQLVNEQEALITVNDVQEMPTYWVGIFEASLELFDDRGQVTVEAVRPPEATFRVRWGL